ncbi:HipA family kinase [Paludibaculum fermentans]|uniref:Aminotransferase class I and II n=1 Tax=Paludibaculum fermentans TaxID=1473598 RepID=A0A7S7NTL9_PALFE|nr:HipA family kinase [Paludibaculum fermentans]QOY89597.1 aminotransferase class I and II [Paludibaculum fermentans]
MLRTVQATRYVTPLREGGSLPAIVEADDLGLYVVKFRGAGQGPLALVAELIAGEIGRALGLNVPELVFIEVDAGLGRNDPDYEIRQLLQASVGLNLALDYLPGSTMFDPAARDKAPADQASMAVWFDSFVTNIDRTASNPNLLLWHKALYFIDHGAALYFHHNWQSLDQMAQSAFPAVKKHLLLRWASAIRQAETEAKLKLNESVFAAILDQVPDAWLVPNAGDGDAATRRAGYLRFLTERLTASASFTEEALRARSELV